MTSPKSVNGISAGINGPLDINVEPPGIPINYRSKSAGSTKMGREREGETEIPGKGQDGIKNEDADVWMAEKYLGPAAEEKEGGGVVNGVTIRGLPLMTSALEGGGVRTN